MQIRNLRYQNQTNKGHHFIFKYLGIVLTEDGNVALNTKFA